MFLKERQDGKIKVRTVVGGNKQLAYITKKDDSSTTVTKYSVFLKSIVDAKENRDITGIDIPNVFIQKHIKKKKYMSIIKLRGVLVNKKWVVLYGIEVFISCGIDESMVATYGFFSHQP